MKLAEKIRARVAVIALIVLGAVVGLAVMGLAYWLMSLDGKYIIVSLFCDISL